MEKQTKLVLWNVAYKAQLTYANVLHHKFVLFKMTYT